MHLYKAYHSSEQNVFHHSAEGNDQNLQPIVSLVAALAESSFGERICKIRFGLFSGARLRRASLDSAATVIKKSLDEEAAFAQTEKLSFKCFFIEKATVLEFFPSFRPVDAEKASGWLQRRLLVMRSHSQIWILLPKP